MSIQTAAATRIAAAWRGYQIRAIFTKAKSIQNWFQHEYLYYRSCHTYHLGKQIAFEGALRLTEERLNNALLHRPYNRFTCVQSCYACSQGIERSPVDYSGYDSDDCESDLDGYFST